MDPGIHSYSFGPKLIGDGWGETYQIDDGRVYVNGDDLRVEYTGSDGQLVVATFRRVPEGDSAALADSVPEDTDKVDTR